MISDDPILANERTEIHTGQQDYLGGFSVAGNNQALSIALSVDGAPSINLAVISATTARQLLDQYVHNPGTTPFAEPPRYMQNIAYGSLWKQIVPVSAGVYFLLLDHASGLGTHVPTTLGDDRAAKVDYLVQVVDAP